MGRPDAVETFEPLMTAEDRLRLILDSTPSLIHTARPDGYLDYFNKPWLEYVGATLDEVSGWNWMAFIHPDDLEGIVARWRTCLATGGIFEYETRVRRADGEYRWMFHRKVPLRDEKGDIVKWYGSSMDIEDRKRAEDALRRSEFYLAEGQRLGHTGSWVFDPAGSFTHWSQELFRIYGLDPAGGAPSVEGYLDCVHPQDRECMAQLIREMVAKGLGCDAKKRIVRSDGEVRYIRCVGTPLVENGVLKSIVGTAMDVTEHEEMTQELRRREAYLAEAQKLSHTGSFGWKPDTGEIVWSDESYRIFEYNPAEKPTLNMVLRRIHPQDRALAQQVIEDSSRSGTDFEHEYRLVTPGEAIKHLHVRAHALRDSSGKIEFIGAVTDITERKRAEDSLRAAMTERARLDAVRAEVGMALARRDSLKGILHACAEAIVHHLDAVFARIWTLTSDGLQLELQASAGIYTRLDGRYSRIPFGRFKIGLIARDRKALVTNDVRHDPRIPDKDWAVAEGMISFAGYPLVVEGRTVGVMGMFSREALGKSTVDTLASIADGIAQGIERKKAEEKLRQSEKQLGDVIETMPVIAFTSLSDGSTDFVNRRWIEYTGLTAEESGYFRSATVHPEDREAHVGKWRASLASGEPFENELRHRGADGQYRWFLVRGVPLRDELGNILKWLGTLTDIEERKRAEERLRNENVALREEIDRGAMFEEIVGTSPALRGVLSGVSKVARMESTVLITGETGTGKELIARAIHKQSPRFSGSFVSVNCAAIPQNLIASELFGHEKGAFTGALQRRLGRFELAERGTIFLDEVADLPPETQVALLRVLQEREFERVGGNQAIRADVRVIAATNRDLQAAIGAGTFRDDLFYRLNVFPIHIPPLRERKDDIPILVEYFIVRYAANAGKTIRNIHKKTMDLLQSYPWPGNIRELQNVIERSVIVCETETLSVDERWLSRVQAPAAPASPKISQYPEKDERQLVEAALARTRGRVSGPSGAAVALGMPASTLESKIRALKIDKYRFRSV